MLKTHTRTFQPAGGKMAPPKRSEILGKLLFAAAFAAVLIFFWWLLVYGHGAGN